MIDSSHVFIYLYVYIVFIYLLRTKLKSQIENIRFDCFEWPRVVSYRHLYDTYIYLVEHNENCICEGYYEFYTPKVRNGLHQYCC